MWRIERTHLKLVYSRGAQNQYKKDKKTKKHTPESIKAWGYSSEQNKKTVQNRTEEALKRKERFENQERMRKEFEHMPGFENVR